MIEISKLNSNLLLDTVSYSHLIEYINKSIRNYPNFDFNMPVIIYIDSTSNYDYLMKIESSSLLWAWQLFSYNVDGSYLVIRTTLNEVLEHIRVYQNEAPMQ